MIEWFKGLFGGKSSAPTTNNGGWEPTEILELPENLAQMGDEGIKFVEELPDEILQALSQSNKEYLLEIYQYLKKNSK